MSDSDLIRRGDVRAAVHKCIGVGSCGDGCGDVCGTNGAIDRLPSDPVAAAAVRLAEASLEAYDAMEIQHAAAKEFHASISPEDPSDFDEDAQEASLYADEALSAARDRMYAEVAAYRAAVAKRDWKETT